MKSRRLLFINLGVLLATLIGGGFWWQHATQARDRVAALLPAVPDLSSTSTALAQRISEADTKALSRRDPTAGLIELSRLYHANGYLESAMIAYLGLAELQPNEARWPHLHATILAGYGRATEALTLWQRTLELAPDYLPARLRYADLLLKDNQTQAAAVGYEAALKVDSNNAYALLGLARIDFEAQRWNDARRRLEKVVGQTNYTLGYDLIVSLYEQLGLTARAEAIRGQARASGAYRDPEDPWLDEILPDSYDPFMLALEAGTKGRRGQPAAAIALLQQAIAVAPTDLSAHFQLANLYYEQRNLDQARELYIRCTQLDPEFADGWARLSDLYAQTGNPGEAARILETGLKACPDSPGLHLMKARRQRAVGEYGPALTSYRKSISLRPNEPDAYLELGIALIDFGRRDMGIQQIRLALETDPANPTALGVLAFNAIELGQQTEATSLLKRVAAQPVFDPQQFQQLQAVYSQKFGTAWTE
jgi:tetratricopeptide (TPR) repeat protein